MFKMKLIFSVLVLFSSVYCSELCGKQTLKVLNEAVKKCWNEALLELVTEEVTVGDSFESKCHYLNRQVYQYNDRYA